jgi:hypothetical protein
MKKAYNVFQRIRDISLDYGAATFESRPLYKTYKDMKAAKDGYWEEQVELTGRWKLEYDEQGQCTLYLEVITQPMITKTSYHRRYIFFGKKDVKVVETVLHQQTTWVHEDELTIRRKPYIGECERKHFNVQ